MKKIFMILLMIIINLSSVLSQIPSWPPDGLQPSPYQLMLPGNRFIPSTERYNLVWADQIVPSWVTPGQVEFAAKNYVGIQKIWDYQITEFRNYNPNFLGLIYHLAAGLNPEHNDDCPNPKSNSGSGFIGVVSPSGYVSEWTEHFLPWLSEKGIETGTDRFEEMFQHYDEFDNNHRVWHQDPYWLMNLENEDWQNYLNDQCIDWMQGNEDEGCFFDVSVETYVSLYNPNQYNPAPTNFNWWQSPHKPYNYSGTFNTPAEYAVWMNELYLKYYQNIYRNFHRAVADYLVIPNVDQMITTVYDPVWLDGDNNGETIDGAMIENFGGATGQDMYLTIDRCIRHITGRGKILIAQFNADTPEERFRRTAMYMLVKNENSFINIIPGEVGWYPEYEIDLGEQSKCPKTLQEIQFENSVWERKYSNGRIICNTSSESVLIEPLMWIPEAPGWEYIIKTSGGDEVSDDGIPMPDSIEYIAFTEPVDLLPSECLIIRIEGGTDVRELEEKDEIKLYPNPANDFLTVKFSLGAKPKEIKIFDMLGNCIKVIKVNPTNNAGIDVSDLKVGIYYIQIISSKQIFTNKFLKID